MLKRIMASLILFLFYCMGCTTPQKIHTSMSLNRIAPKEEIEENAEDTRNYKLTHDKVKDAVYSEDLKNFPDRWTDAAATKAGPRKTAYLHLIANGGEEIDALVSLYTSDVFLVEQVLRENPFLKGRGVMEPGEHLRIPMSMFRPQISHITLNFLLPYKKEIDAHYEQMRSRGDLEERYYRPKDRDSYRRVSEVVFGTPLRWKEIFMYNLDHIQQFGRLRAGKPIRYLRPIQRATSQRILLPKN